MVKHLSPDSKTHITIVSRKSVLAIWQANFIKEKLEYHYPHLKITILGLSTTGDMILNKPLNKIGGKGLFVKELEEALLNHQADLAVHSMKDVPNFLHQDLEIPVIVERSDARDVLLTRHLHEPHDNVVKHLPKNASIGTSSLRREAQILNLRKDLKPKMLRGNVETRIKKLMNGEYDAIILAAAGLKRLKLDYHIKQYFSPHEILPAIGQGALGLECRKEDHTLKTLIQALQHDLSFQSVMAERSMNALLGGSCLLPVAGLAEVDNNGMLHLQGLVASKDGTKIIRAEDFSLKDQALELGQRVAHQLLSLGAGDILKQCVY